MGRYAFFNTGFEYKFVFGVQASYDILEFFGKSNYNNNYSFNIHEYMHEWVKSDKDFILDKLKKYSYNLVDFNKYANNIDGTYELKWDLEKVCSNYQYILGCIIYHQLQYIDELKVNYEI